MTNNLKHRQEKIQAKRKKTPWREFVMEIASWYTINLNRNSGMISRYPETDRIGSIIDEEKYQDMGDQMFSTPYDNAQGFFDTLFALRKKFHHPNRITFAENQSSEYADVVFGAKDAYLSFTIGGNVENVLYSTISYINCTNIVNSVSVADNSENVFSSKVVTKSFNVFYSKYIDNSSDVRFSSNLIGCKHCIKCDNLTNQSYCINNQPVGKEQYMKHKQHILAQKHKFDAVASRVNNIAVNHQSEDVVGGGGVNYATDITNGYYINRATNGRNMMFVSGINHANNYFDVFEAGVDSDDFYAVSNAGTHSNHLYCSTQIEGSSHLFYCYHLEHCSYCLGCIGLKNKSYCIFNKQYTKEERHKKVDEIFTQMEKDGDLGKFFPGSMNPFYFNDTAAYLIDDSFTKEEVEAAGYLRRDEAISVDIPAGATVVKTSELDRYEGWIIDGTFTSLAGGGTWTEGASRSIDPEILKVIIQDEQGNVYRIIPMEYQFLKKHGLPLPRQHWLDRLKQNFKIG